MYEIAQIVYLMPQAPPPGFLTTSQYQTGSASSPRESYAQNSTQTQPSTSSRLSVSTFPSTTSTSRHQSPAIQSQSTPTVLNKSRSNHLPSFYSEAKPTASSASIPRPQGRLIPKPCVPPKPQLSSQSQSYIPSVLSELYNSRPIQPLISPNSQVHSVSSPRSTTIINPSRQYLSNLPGEILELIVSYTQSTNYSDRLQHNLSLSLVCRSLDRIARRKLREEIHITKPFQLEKLDVLVRLNPDRMSEVKFLSIELNIDDLRWKRGTLWSGNYFQFVINSVASSVQRLSLTLKDSGQPLSDKVQALTEATGGKVPIFDQFPNVKEMMLYFEIAESDMRKMLMVPLVNIKTLHIDSIRNSGECITTRIGGAGTGSGKISPKEQPVEVEITSHPWKILSLPGVTLTPRKLIDSLPKAGSKLKLEHLDCILRLPIDKEELADYIQLFDHLAPTIVHLSIQLVGIIPTTSANLESFPSPVTTAIAIDLCRYFTILVNLTSLNMSVLYIDSSITLSLLKALSTLPALFSLRLLSFLSPTNSPLDLSEDLIKILTGEGDEPAASFPHLKYLGVSLPRGRDRSES